MTQIFIGFMDCPVCDRETRHYTTLAVRQTKHHRTVYCDVCRVTRYQTKKEAERMEVKIWVKN